MTIRRTYAVEQAHDVEIRTSGLGIEIFYADEAMEHYGVVIEWVNLEDLRHILTEISDQRAKIERSGTMIGAAMVKEGVTP